jgi:hypothetical protein
VQTTPSEVDWFDDYRPTRFQMIPIKARRIYYKRKTSTPFLSGDAFAKFSDIHIKTMPLDSQNLRVLKNSKVVFIDSGLFLDFSSEHATELPKGSTLITSNGDYDVTYVPDFILEKEIRWFTQNLMIPEGGGIHALPAGIENIDFGRNGLPKNLKSSHLREVTDDRILFGPFGDTHSSRSYYLTHALEMQEIFFVPPKRVEPAKMSQITKRFKFVFCPRGNGFDSHRFWETLYRGRYPIVEDSPWSRNMKNLGFPIVVVSNILDVTPHQLKELHSIFSANIDPTKYKALWMPYWQQRIYGENV